MSGFNNNQSKKPHLRFLNHLNLDSKSGSGSDSGSDDEYIHPLLQAHRRPIKTQGDISDPENAEQGASDDSSVLNRNNVVSYLMQRQLPNSVYSNAAEVYMARKYEHLRKDILNDKDFAIGKNKNITDDNWADQLEEDKHFSLFGNCYVYLQLNYVISFLCCCCVTFSYH